MKKDIDNTEDIRHLVDRFYSKVQQDAALGYIFNDVAGVAWEEHLPRMYGFWETVLFGRASFKGNPVAKHLALSKKTCLTGAHFDRWVQLWCEAVDALFDGDVAGKAKNKAGVMKTFMSGKVREQYEQRTGKIPCCLPMDHTPCGDV